MDGYIGETTGMDELLKCLDGMTDGVDEAVTEALCKGADIIVEGQKFLAPESKSGKLKNAVHRFAPYSNKKGRINVRCGIDFENGKNRDVLFAAIITEFGRPGKKSKGVDKIGRKIGKVSARPFIRPGFDARKEQAIAVMTEEFRKFVESKWRG